MIIMDNTHCDVFELRDHITALKKEVIRTENTLWDVIKNFKKHNPKALSSIEYNMLKMRFWQGMTYHAIGEKYSVTTERIRQRIEKGLGNIKYFSDNK